MIYFNSDYLEGAHPAIMEKLVQTNMEQTIGYSCDEYCEAAREKIKAACQAPEAVTMGNSDTIHCFQIDPQKLCITDQHIRIAGIK